MAHKKAPAEGHQHSDEMLFGLAKHTKDRLQSKTDHNVNKAKEHRSKCRHRKNHDCCQQHFTACRPNDLGDFGTNLLNELHWICCCHWLYPLS